MNSKKSSNDVQIHPLSYQALKKGHPWITADKFSRGFPASRNFLITSEFVLINDPKHPQIKARVWQKSPAPKKEISHFWKQMSERLEIAMKRRIDLNLSNQRENYYLCFGEGDRIPGLFIQKLGPVILIQIYCFFWEKNFDRLRPIIKEQLKKFNIGPIKFFKQIRGVGEQDIIPLQHDAQAQFTIKEFGLSYHIDLGSGLDFGIYTDMASIRAKLNPFLEGAHSALNLYSYTGAFSLQLLKKCNTTSVDLSPKYMTWLQKNLDLNKDLIKHSHQTLQMSTQAALKQLKSKKNSFDFIICDPPSFSSDGKNNTNSMESYKRIIPQMVELLNDKGKMLLCLNTHKTPPGKFYQIVEDSLAATKYKVLAKYTLSEDCPVLPYFKEGNYLKAILIEIYK